MRLTHSLLWVTCALLPLSVARAQVDTPKALEEEARPAESESESERDPPTESAEIPADKPGKSGKKTASPPVAPKADAPAAPALPTVKAPQVTQLTDADLEEVLVKWRKALLGRDTRAADEAQRQLTLMRAEIGAEDLEAYALTLMRASEERERANDLAGAVGMARAAVELAPHFPFAHIRLSSAYLFADKTEPGRVLSALGTGLKMLTADPRYLRPTLMDFFAALFFAVLATSIAVVAVLFLRRARYFLHDFHHAFPRGAAMWQTNTVAALLLAVPLVFRLGVVPSLFALVIAVSFYLSLMERILAAALLCLLAMTPLIAGEAVTRTDFAGTPAEDVYIAERGGRSGADAAARLTARAQAGNPTYAELYALGRFEYRRGKLESAITHLKAAGSLRNDQSPLLTNLGNALFAKGDFDGAAEMYRSAMAADPTFAPPAYNLSRLHALRGSSSGSVDVAAREKLLSDDAMRSATLIDPSLSRRQEPPPERFLANLLLISPGLGVEELSALTALTGRGEKIRAQLSSSLLGELDPPLAYLYPLVLGIAAVLLGFLGRGLATSRECTKCGRPVCRRCDPELSIASELCNQCVHVFARKGAVAAAMKVRKQIEVSRHQDRTGKLSYLLAIICSGAGHLFSGLPLRGTAYAFFFLFTLFSLFFREGVVRAPYAELPVELRLVPLGLLLCILYISSLRGLQKRQSL